MCLCWMYRIHEVLYTNWHVLVAVVCNCHNVHGSDSSSSSTYFTNSENELNYTERAEEIASQRYKTLLLMA